MVSAWFLSDIHLKSLDEPKGQILLQFLKNLKSGRRVATHVFFLGDIFDLWVGDHRVFRNKFAPFIELVTQMRRQGIQVEYFEGNHDVHVKGFWQGEVGIPCWTAERFVQLGDLLIRMEHGDLINTEDQAYLRYRSIIRKPWMEGVAQLLPGQFVDSVGNFLSRKSRQRSSVARTEQQELLRAMIHRYAEASFASAPFDVMISGHMHVLDEYSFEAEGRTVKSYNLGSWFDGPIALHLDSRCFNFIDLENEKREIAGDTISHPST